MDGVKRSVRIASLVLSHAAVLALAAATTAGYVVRTAFQKAAADPLHRVGVRLELGSSDTDSAAAVESAAQEIGADLGQPTKEMLRLVQHLHEDNLAAAAAACTKLRWERCDLA